MHNGIDKLYPIELTNEPTFDILFASKKSDINVPNIPLTNIIMRTYVSGHSNSSI